MKKQSGRSLAAALVILLFAIAWLVGRETPQRPTGGDTTLPLSAASSEPSPVREGASERDDDEAIATEPEAKPHLSAEEQLARSKQIDRDHLRQIHGALFAYKAALGHFPEYLSQLAPEFLDPGALESPRQATDGMNAALVDHPDPALAQPAYAFEFSNLVFRDGRTFEDIKEVQRAEWGDAVPILRAFGYEKPINMAYSGDLYETALNWEWDSATLDIVATRGWGPGLSDGEFTRVRVLDAAGAPVANAEVWADGRHYSFDLPNRPFATDAQGFVQIPLGVDLDRTVLGLRAVTPNAASPLVAFAAGDVPSSYELRIDPAQAVGGSVIDERGNPVADAWVYLKNPDGRALSTVKTDALGRWTASLNPSDAAAFNLAIVPKFERGEPVNASAAARNSAVVTFHSPAK